MRVYLIRHFATKGNLERRYIGKTDESLCGSGIMYSGKECCPRAERLYVSPLKRCLETAEIIYPGQQRIVVPELSECDFGLFENKNYEELSGCPQYQKWIDSGGRLPFPGGESREEFQERSVCGFEKVIQECIREDVASAAFVVHGGTIMSIMEKYAFPKGGYYDYQVGNGEGYELIVEDGNSGDGRIRTGFDTGRSGMAVSSGQVDGTSHNRNRRNYKRLYFGNETK